MKKTREKLFKIAGLLCIAGAVFYLISLIAVGFDFTRLDTVNYETKTYKVGEMKFDGMKVGGMIERIWIEGTTADICFFGSETNKVICHETEKLKYSVGIEDGTLFIKAEDTRKGLEHVGISYEDAKVEVYLSLNSYELLVLKNTTGDVNMPKEFRFDNVMLETDTGEVNWRASVDWRLELYGGTGDVSVRDSKVGELDIKTTTGEVCLKNTTVGQKITVETDTGSILLDKVLCGDLTTESGSGALTLKDTTVTEECYVLTETGDVSFKRFDAKYSKVQTDTGDVKGTLPLGAVFSVESETGDIRVPKSNTSSAKICEVSTNTGDIEIELAK